MRYCRANWPNESIPPKIHFLEDHIVEFIKKWKVGLGYVGSILYYLFLESTIEEFMRYCRANWPNESIPPKIHFLEDHIVEFIKKWKVGLGFYGEQSKKK